METMKIITNNDDDDNVFNNSNNNNTNNNNNTSSPVSDPSQPSQHQQQQQKNQQQHKNHQYQQPKNRSLILINTITILLHLFGCWVYLLPLTTHSYESNQPVLDELHVCSADNVDVNGPLPFIDILKHDYWGRPMTAENSHKSWRPFTILSFRYLGGGGGRRSPNHHPLTTYAYRWMTTLTLHRLVNVLLHAATADLVAILATRLFTMTTITTTTPAATTTTTTTLPHPMFVLYALTKLLFLLHPTHVEVTANAANRNHLLATMFSLLLCNVVVFGAGNGGGGTSDGAFSFWHQWQWQWWCSWLLGMPLLLLLGFASSETFLFQIPAILVTTTVLEFVKRQQQQQEQQPQEQQQQQPHSSSSSSSSSSSPPSPHPSSLSLLLQTLQALLFRHAVVIAGAVLYGWGRYHFDTLTIPTGLLRPAENPLAHFTGWNRFWNYSYVTALHVMKSIGIDVLGFSHEYGERCIEPLHLIQPSIVAIVASITGIHHLLDDDDDDDPIFKHLLVPYDVRILLPLALVVLLVAVTWYCLSVANLLPSSPRPSSRQVTTTTTTKTASSNDNQESDNINNNKNNNNDNESDDHDAIPNNNENNNIHNHENHKNNNNNNANLMLFPLLLWLMHLSWLVTLFPITGIVKVGTFISDRIVVPSTVSVCILLGAGLTKLLAYAYSNAAYAYSAYSAASHSSSSSSAAPKKQTSKTFLPATALPSVTIILAIFIMLSVMWRRIHVRSLQWMDSLPLLESSLRTCPNFAKGHLEISKVYSGLYPMQFNLTKSKWHLEQVERIDPTYCDVHQQFAHVALQQMQYLEFEQRLVQAMLCPFTMGGAVEMWKRYWQAVLNSNSGPTTTISEPQRRQAQLRQQQYTLQIQQAVAAASSSSSSSSLASSSSSSSNP